jgi:hypothetical protein
VIALDGAKTIDSHPRQAGNTLFTLLCGFKDVEIFPPRHFVSQAKPQMAVLLPVQG